MFHRTATVALGLAASLSILQAQESLKPIHAEGRIVDCEVSDQAKGSQRLISLRKVAESGFREMLAQLRSDIAPGTLPDGFPFDVKDFSELSKATIGYGFQVHTVDPRQLIASSLPLEHLIIPTPIWNFLVLVEDRPVALLEVEKIEGRWQVVGAGASELAQDLNVMAETHAQGQDFRFVRVYQATSDLMEVKDGAGSSRFVPLTAARQSLRMAKALRGTQLQDGATMATALRNSVAANLTYSH